MSAGTQKLVLTSSGSLRPAKMFPFSLGFCLLGLFSLGDVSRGGGGGGGGGATLSLVGEIVSSNHRPKIGSLSSSARKRTNNSNEFLYVSDSSAVVWWCCFNLLHDTYDTVDVGKTTMFSTYSDFVLVNIHLKKRTENLWFLVDLT